MPAGHHPHSGPEPTRALQGMVFGGPPPARLCSFSFLALGGGGGHLGCPGRDWSREAGA